MLQFLIRWLLGYCCFTVETAAPIRLYNRLHQQDIYFWRPKTLQTGAVFRCSRRSAGMAYDILRRQGVTQIEVKAHGLPTVLSTVGRRISFAAAVLLMLGAFLLPRFFVMDITISGSRSVPEESILAVLAKEGIREYAYIPRLPLKQARQQLLLSEPKLS